MRRVNRLVILLVVFSSCEFLKMKEIPESEDVSKGTVIASVENKKLFLDDLNGLVTPSTTTEDSQKFVEKYVTSWIKKQLLLKKAASNIEFNNAEMERKILDYKYALTVHEYQKFYIEKRLNKEVSEEEIQAYYDSKSDNFILKKNIVRCLYAKIPLEAPKLKKFRKNFSKHPESDIADLKSYCFTFAAKYSFEEDLWLSFDDVISGTPLVTIPNKVQFLRKNSLVEQEDESFLYLFKFLEYKFSEQISPIEFVKDDIVNIIINKRKTVLKEQLEEEIYLEAKKNNEFEVY